MDRHNPHMRAIRHMAHVEAKKRAAAVARFGLVIAFSVTVALVLFAGQKLPMQ